MDVVDDDNNSNNNNNETGMADREDGWLEGIQMTPDNWASIEKKPRTDNR